MAHWKKQPSNKELLPLVEQWYQRQPGQRLLQAEQHLIDEELSSCFGYHLLQLSVCRQLNLVKNSRVQSNFISHPMGDNNGLNARCNFDELPFATDSLDAVILHHSQEFVANPHNTLREVQRIVVPNGKVIIIGFNPWSLLGLYSKASSLWSDSLWHNHLLSCRRVIDWLNLLGFKVSLIRYAFHRPPVKSTKIFDRLSINRQAWWQLLPGGGVYMISAVKHVEGMTVIPSKPQWTKTPGFAGLSVIKPSARVPGSDEEVA
jgi:SAM-dependent methyltransferase